MSEGSHPEIYTIPHWRYVTNCDLDDRRIATDWKLTLIYLHSSISIGVCYRTSSCTSTRNKETLPNKVSSQARLRKVWTVLHLHLHLQLHLKLQFHWSGALHYCRLCKISPGPAPGISARLSLSLARACAKCWHALFYLDVSALLPFYTVARSLFHLLVAPFWLCLMIDFLPLFFALHFSSHNTVLNITEPIDPPTFETIVDTNPWNFTCTHFPLDQHLYIPSNSG